MLVASSFFCTIGTSLAEALSGLAYGVSGDGEMQVNCICRFGMNRNFHGANVV